MSLIHWAKIRGTVARRSVLGRNEDITGCGIHDYGALGSEFDKLHDCLVCKVCRRARVRSIERFRKSARRWYARIMQKTGGSPAIRFARVGRFAARLHEKNASRAP